MRVMIHDFGGYPFPIQLSRELAKRGHQVLHAFCGSLKTTPGGDHEKRLVDSESFQVAPLTLAKPLEKYSFVKRWRQENAYGRIVVKAACQFQPDIVVSANTPLDAQLKLAKFCRSRQVPFVFWLQDVLSVATDRLLRKKLPIAGRVIGKYYLRIESSLLRNAALSFLITDDFRPLLADWGVDHARCITLENWAPIDELPVRPKDNTWAREHDLVDKFCVVYTGTLGMKHNPDLILRIALRLRHQPDARVVVVSEGLGANWLKAKAKEHGLSNLLVLGYGPFEQVPDVMGTADVLTAILEFDAGSYSVPSKVLAYLCAQRPIVLAIPTDNLAAKIVCNHHAGVCVNPSDSDGYEAAVVGLMGNPRQRQAMGLAGRHYAEQKFDITKITNVFESNLLRLC
jgi:colanic acid biosynthesis glycosyl transferase WcaI